MNKIQVLNLDFVYNIQLALRLWLVLMQNWGRDFDWFWCKIGLGGWDFYAKLGRWGVGGAAGEQSGSVKQRPHSRTNLFIFQVFV